jgi:maltooligosyltrehalose synthase
MRRRVVPYLARLGISDLYLSPVFEARRQHARLRRHGPDTHPRSHRRRRTRCDALAAETPRHGMGILLDIVPNHMAASPRTRGGVTCCSERPASGTRTSSTLTGAHPAPRRLQLPILGEDLASDRARRLTIDPGKGNWRTSRRDCHSPLGRSSDRGEGQATATQSSACWRRAALRARHWQTPRRDELPAVLRHHGPRGRPRRG